MSNPDAPPDVQADITELGKLLLEIRVQCLATREISHKAERLLGRIVAATAIRVTCAPVQTITLDRPMPSIFDDKQEPRP
jgi:hypothetical protein